MSYTFDHVAQVVPDIAAAVAFYTELLPDAKLLYQDESWAFVEAGGVKLAFVVKDQHPGHLAWRLASDGKPLGGLRVTGSRTGVVTHEPGSQHWRQRRACIGRRGESGCQCFAIGKAASRVAVEAAIDCRSKC